MGAHATDVGGANGDVAKFQKGCRHSVPRYQFGTFIYLRFLTVKLHGRTAGLSLYNLTSDYLPFGSVASGSAEVMPLIIRNVGLPGTVTIGTTITVRSTTRPTTTYTILTTSENTCLAGIAAGQTCTLPIEFAPTTSGTHDDLLTLTPFPAGGATTVWLNGSTP